MTDTLPFSNTIPLPLFPIYKVTVALFGGSSHPPSLAIDLCSPDKYETLSSLITVKHETWMVYRVFISMFCLFNCLSEERNCTGVMNRRTMSMFMYFTELYPTLLLPPPNTQTTHPTRRRFIAHYFKFIMNLKRHLDSRALRMKYMSTHWNLNARQKS